MRRSSESPESGSARKRARLSSPTYEEHFPITQEDVETFDELERQLSQSVPVVPPHSRSLPSETEASGMPATNRRSIGLEKTETGAMDEAWQSSPIKPSTTQDRVADDSFVSTGSGGGGGFVSAASLPAKPQQGRPSGFTSASCLSSHASHSRPSNGFTSAAKLPDPPTSPREHEDDHTTASTLAKYGGFGRASAIPLPSRSDNKDAYDDDHDQDHASSPSRPPPQDYDAWFSTDVSTLPPDAFTFKTARTITDSSTGEDPPASQPFKPLKFTSGSSRWTDDPLSQGEVSSGPVNACLSVAGFAPAAAVGFSSVASVGADSAPQAGFSSAAALNGRKPNWAAPSAEALARAAARMKQWEYEYAHEETAQSNPFDDVENDPAGPSNPQPPPPQARPLPPMRSVQPPTSQPFRTPLRPALRPMENGGHSPARLPDTPLASKNPVHYTNIGGGLQMKNKQFKSPLLPLDPGRRVASTSKLPSAFGFGAASALPAVRPSAPASPPTTPLRPGKSVLPTGTPATSPGKGRSLGMTPRRTGGPGGLSSASVAKGKVKSTFSTPFKAGMAPGEAGRRQLVHDKERAKANGQTRSPVRVYATDGRSAAASTPYASNGKGKEKARKEYRFFDFNPRPERKTLATSGLQPLSYTEDELEDMGINVDELRQMSPSNAIYYKFHTPVPAVDLEEPPQVQLGPEEALARLRELGCTLATLEWVTNHYGLILWKLAGMVCLEPEHEHDPETKRWCWPEVIRQLLYRYERELNGGSRPALRMICTEDAPASCPMVLCVSNIMWSPAAVDKNGVPFDPHPELEVTDGWYRLRAQVDLPLARAVRRGFIKVGTKLAVSGTKLSGDRKEACEILEAYDSTMLELSGNSTHLASWHAKLGFVKEPFVATLDSLTADGGRVPAMDLEVIKAYSVAYLEFSRGEDGSVTKIGPHGEKDELKLQDQWLTKRENEIAKIRANLEKDIIELEKTAERLQSIAGARFQTRYKPEEPLPDHIDSLYSEIVEAGPRPSSSQLSQRLNYMDAGWLHVYTQDQIQLARERINDDIERELQYACPPRTVRDFRIVVVKDARWHRKEPRRSAQVTLWDAMRMVFSDGGEPGDIRVGQRFFVTNLEPSQPSAWMTPGPESVIYLVSKKNARWTNVKARRY